MRKSQAEKDRAAARLRAERQIALASLAGEAFCFPDGTILHPHTKQLLRWGTAGCRGVFLDVAFDEGSATWMTSRAAVARFVVAVGRARAGVAHGS